MVLLDIYMRLHSLEKSLQDYGLPIPISEELAQVEQIVSVLPAVICEVMDFDIGELKNTVAERQLSLLFSLSAVRDETPLLAFIDARGDVARHIF